MMHSIENMEVEKVFGEKGNCEGSLGYLYGVSLSKMRVATKQGYQFPGTLGVAITGVRMNPSEQPVQITPPVRVAPPACAALSAQGAAPPK